MFNAVIDAPFGKVGIRLEGETVREIVYLPNSTREVGPDTSLAKLAVEQIERYFERASALHITPTMSFFATSNAGYFRTRAFRTHERHSG